MPVAGLERAGRRHVARDMQRGAVSDECPDHGEGAADVDRVGIEVEGAGHDVQIVRERQRAASVAVPPRTWSRYSGAPPVVSVSVPARMSVLVPGLSRPPR